MDVDRHFRDWQQFYTGARFDLYVCGFLINKRSGAARVNRALKNVLLTLKVICMHLAFPVADLMISSFLTELLGFWICWVGSPIGETFNTEYSSSLSVSIKLHSSSSLTSETSSTTSTLRLDLPHLAKWLFLLYFLHVTFFAGHESLWLRERYLPQKWHGLLYHDWLWFCRLLNLLSKTLFSISSVLDKAVSQNW